MAEEADDPLDRLLHAVEILERRIDLDGPVRENTAEARILAGIHHDRLADRLQQALGGARIKARIIGAGPQVVLKRELHLPAALHDARIKARESLVQTP